MSRAIEQEGDISQQDCVRGKAPENVARRMYRISNQVIGTKQSKRRRCVESRRSSSSSTVLSSFGLSGSSRSCSRFLRILAVFLFLLSSFTTTCAELQRVSREDLLQTKREKIASIQGDKHFMYLGEEFSPVHDYRGDATTGETEDEPSFLFGDESHFPRIVEFYAPWCPHCQHFKHQYATFAKQLTQLATENDAHPVPKVWAVSCTAHRTLCHKYGVHGYPKLLLFPAGSSNSTGEANYWRLHPFQVLNELGVHVEQLKLNLAAESVQPLGKASLGGKRKTDQQQQQQEQDKVKYFLFPQRTKQQIYDDAYRSFHFNLRTGIFMADTLDNSTVSAFRHWLDLLQIALPPTWSPMQPLLNDLLKQFDFISQSEDNLLQIVDQHPPPHGEEWSDACTHNGGSSVSAYPCGLWQLFHIMTVGVVEWNLMINTDDSDEIVLSTEHAAVTLRNFVEHFFGCEVCRNNFLAAFDTCAHDRCNRLSLDKKTASLSEWIQLPVWLFETHNSVNKRLLHEQAEREDWMATPQDERNRQWPSQRECAKCWNDDHGGFTDTHMYKFLRTEYWPEDFIAKEYRQEIMGRSSQSLSSVEKSDEESLSSSSSSRFDLKAPSLIMMLIPLGIALGLAAAHHMKRIELLRSGRHKKDDFPCRIT